MFNNNTPSESHRGINALIIVLIAALCVFISNTAAEQNQAPAASTTAQSSGAQPPAAQAVPAAPSNDAQATAAATNELSATISKLKGASVQISHDAGQTWQTAKVGDKLAANARVRTGFASECEISFANLTVVQVQPLSSLDINDYSGNSNGQKVNASLNYGAVRCGVEKGRIVSDTKITTPVSTLSIRGTMVYVEYDPGTRRCLLWTVEDGPALAETSEGKYMLDEGMDTDCSLGRYLERASFRRDDYIRGNRDIGSISDTESHTAVHQDGTIDPTDGAGQNNSEKSRGTQKPSGILEIPGGDTPIGSTKP